MRDLSVFERFSLGFLVILMVLVSLGIYSTFKLGQLGRITRSINSIDNVIINTANKLSDAIISQREFEKKYFILGDEDFYCQFKEIEAYVKEYIAKLTVSVSDPGQLMRVEKIKDLFTRYVALVDREADLLKKNKAYNRIGSEEEKKAIVNELNLCIKQFKEEVEKNVAQKIRMSEKIGASASKVVAAATGIALVLSVIIALINAQTISRPLLLLINGIKEIAEGNFEKQIEVDISSPPEIKDLAYEFNYMSRRLKELDEIKSDIISHVSHELRTPLAIIKESVSLLSSGKGFSSLTERQRRLLAIIGEECERLIATVNRILDLSRMEAGKNILQKDKASVGALIGRSVATIRPLFQKKEIELDIHIDADVPLVYVDGDKICQVLNILLENAAKFTPPSGYVSVRAIRDTTESSNSRLSYVRVSVSDNGCGIQEKQMGEIFSKFKTFDSKGTGLGLYIAKSIVTAHGGKIWVESTEGNGSTFYFTVPVFS